MGEGVNLISESGDGASEAVALLEPEGEVGALVIGIEA
jgi:hypothetical protein